MSTRDDFGAELAVAILAARRAAAAILDHRPRHEVSIKPDGTPVTSADLAADAVIRATVREAFPRDALLTEEGTDDPALAPASRRRLATKGWLGAPANLVALEAVAAAVNGSLLLADWSLCPRCFAVPNPSIEAMVGLAAGAPVEAWEWDIAALDLIVREAGGAASDVGGAPLRYNRPEPRFATGLVIAADPALHGDLIAALGRSAAEQRP